MLSSRLLFVLLFVDLLAARGDTIENFVLLNSSNPNIVGGAFAQGGNYYGSFSIDTSQIPSDGSETHFSLTSFDIFTTGAFNIEFNSSQADTTGDFVAAAEFPTGSSEAQFDQLKLQMGLYIINLTLLEPAGSFHGGLVYYAEELREKPRGEVTDSSGSALVIDPALIPEPSSGLFVAAGVTLLAALTKRRACGSCPPSA